MSKKDDDEFTFVFEGEEIPLTADSFEGLKIDVLGFRKEDWLEIEYLTNDVLAGRGLCHYLLAL